MRIFLFLGLFTFGCEQNGIRKDSCSIQGFNQLNNKNITCQDALVISTADFSNGISYQFIQGKIKLKKKKYPFTVVVDSLQVVQYTFPLIEFDSSDYTCNIKYTSNKMIEIQWVNGKNRLFLRKEITSVN